MKKLLLIITLTIIGSETVRSNDVHYGEILGSMAGTYVGAVIAANPAAYLAVAALAPWLDQRNISTIKRATISASFFGAAVTCVVVGGYAGHKVGTFAGSGIDYLSQR